MVSELKCRPRWWIALVWNEVLGSRLDAGDGMSFLSVGKSLERKSPVGEHGSRVRQWMRSWIAGMTNEAGAASSLRAIARPENDSLPLQSACWSCVDK